MAKVLTSAREVDQAISSASSLAFLGPLTDARSQLAGLVHPGFAGVAGVARLRRIPVYLAGLQHRVTRLAENPGRDRTWQTEVEQATTLYLDAGGTLPLTVDAPPRLAEVRWMLEELRLSLFAQHLGAAGPVSVQRIRKALAE
jgi:ATP-dependent helicase HrpA